MDAGRKLIIQRARDGDRTRDVRLGSCNRSNLKNLAPMAWIFDDGNYGVFEIPFCILY
jgi:hypothetical protein